MSENWHEEVNHHENSWLRDEESENAHHDQNAAPSGIVSPVGCKDAVDHEEENMGLLNEAEEHLEAETGTPNAKKDEAGSSPKPYGGYPYDDEEEEIDLDRYEIARPEFFAHLAEPTFTVNVDKVSVNAACVRMFPDVDFVEIMVYREEKKVLLYPCDEDDYSAYQWSKVKNGRRYSRHRAGEEFVLMLCEMMDWNPDYRYQILGKRARAKGKKALSFDLNVYKCYEKIVTENGKRKNRSFMHMDSVGRFGPTYAESKRSLDVKKFGQYTVIKVNKKKGRKNDQRPEEQQPEVTQEPVQAPVNNQDQGANAQPEVQQDE